MADQEINKFERAMMSNAGGYHRDQQRANNNNNNPRHRNTNPRNVEPIKKPKMEEGGKHQYFDRAPRPRQNQDGDEQKTDFQLEKITTDAFVSSFIGLDSFESENVFLGLVDREYVLVILGDSAQSQKANLCFKGKCSMALVYGQIEVAGYTTNNFSVLDNSEVRAKWMDMFSPETNSFLAVTNSSKDKNAFEALTNLESVARETQLEILVDAVIRCLNLDETDQSLQDGLRLFLENFSLQSSSLLAIKPLKSAICNYLSSFDNLNHVYNNRSMKKTPESASSPHDLCMAQLGLTSVKSDNFNAILIRSEEEKKIYAEVFPNEIKAANLDKAPIILCAGGKDVGKSTFLRNLINAYLSGHQKIAYLDCDPGQCEFTLGGCISLSLITQPVLGPPHTHLGHSSQDKRSYYLGHLSPNEVPGQYLQFVQQCYQDFLNLQSGQNRTENLPLIVNTMGWNQGLGLCLLKEIILLVQPSHIIQINHPVEANKNMPTLNKTWLSQSDGWPSKKLRAVQKLNEDSGQQNSSMMEIDDPVQKQIDKLSYRLLLIKSYAPFKTPRFQTQAPQKLFSPRDHRNIATIAYFARLHDNAMHFKPIHQLKPYRVPWSKFALHVCHIDVPYQELLKAFNASLVALCTVDPKHIRRINDDTELPGCLNALDGETKQYTIHSCIGFGIIRGIQMESKEFFILTPEPIEVLNEVNLLVKGVLNSPVEFFFQQDSETPCPYMSFAGNNHNQQKPSSSQSNQLSNIGAEPVQRKYLIHGSQKFKGSS